MRKLLNFCVLLLIAVALGCGACGGDGDGTAQVTIDSVDPVGGYPGVEMTVNFTITPGEGTNEAQMTWRVNFGDGSTAAGSGVEGSASHTYERAGQYDIEVEAVFENFVVGTAVEAVRVYSPVDLSISETRASPANASVGDTLQVSFTVTNETAAEVFTAYEVNAYLSTEPAPDLENINELTLLGVGVVEPDAEGEPILASGGDRNSAVPIVIPADVASGDYYIVALLDPRERIADTDRSNNTNVSSSVVRIDNPVDALPDPAVRDLFATPDRAFPQLNSVTRGFVLANNGGQDAFDLIHKTYVSVGDDQLDGDDLLIDTSEPVTVFPNDQQDIGPELITLPVGQEIVPPNNQELQAWVIVTVESSDPNQGDVDETNNITTLVEPILITDQPVMGPDIVVKDFVVTPTSTFLNGPLEVTTTIANEGTVDVGSFFCGIYLGDRPVVNTNNDPRLANINIPSLGAAEEINQQLPITVPGLFDPGVYFLYIVCDPLNALQEPFRSNNAFVFLEEITITDEADVDLYVESFDAPTPVNENDMIQITPRICVSGSNPSGLTTARLHLSPGTTVDFETEPVMVLDIPNINPGDCLDLTIDVTASCDDFEDTYTYGILLDADARLPENDEANNRGTSNPLVVNGEFCTCTEDGFEPNDSVANPTLLPAGPTPAAICTAGNCDFYSVSVAQTESLIINNSHNSSKGELVTTLFDPSGQTQIDLDASDDEQEVGAILVSQAGDYIARVCGATATDRNIYDLDIQVLPQSAGRDVIPRDLTIPAGDSFSIGARLDVGVRIYNIGVQSTGAFDVEYLISPNKVLGDGDDISVTSTNVAGVVSSGFVDLNTEVAIPVALADGAYTIAVRLDPFGTIGESDTTNNVAFSRFFEVKTECFDPLEPNDSFGEAVDVTPQTYANLVACASGDDYYRYCVADAKRFDVTVNFVDADGDMDLELYNDQFQLIDSSANAGVDVEQVSVDYVNGAQCFYVRTYLATLDPDLETAYEMVINEADVDPALVCDSVFEPNDAFNTASSLLAALNQAFTLDRCPVADSDYYFINLTAGQQVSFTATKNPPMQAGTLRLQLYLPNQTPGPNIETGPGVPTATLSNYIPPQSGQYFVQITVSGNERNVTYDLTASGLSGIDLTPENLAIGPGQYQPNDELRWGFDLTNLLSDLASAPPYQAWYSTNATHDDQLDTLLGTFIAPDVPGNSTTMVFGQDFIPGGAQSGTAYLHIVIDPTDTLGDANTSNNITTVTVPIQ